MRRRPSAPEPRGHLMLARPIAQQMADRARNRCGPPCRDQSRGSERRRWRRPVRELVAEASSQRPTSERSRWRPRSTTRVGGAEWRAGAKSRAKSMCQSIQPTRRWTVNRLASCQRSLIGLAGPMITVRSPRALPALDHQRELAR